MEKTGVNHPFLSDSRFAGLRPFARRLWLSSPTMHGEELRYIEEAIQANWVSTIGANIQEVERITAERIGRRCAVALSSGTAALHLAIKLCGERLYGQPRIGHGTLEGRKVFCSDMTFAASVNPVAQEGGEAVFIDAERDTWNLDPAALERAFETYPDTRLVVAVHLYGTPAKMDEIRAICDKHHALIVEDAAESFGASYKGAQTGVFGDVSIISFNGNKIITGSTGGMLLTDRQEDADKARKWSTQSREAAPWYQHEELGFNYRMSNIVAGIVRGQLPCLEEHIAQKRAIYERYRDGLKDLPVHMNPIGEAPIKAIREVPADNQAQSSYQARPNYWLSCLLIDRETMCRQVRSGKEALYLHEAGKSCPSEILDALSAFNAEGRPIWKPMHMQPCYRMNPFFTAKGTGRANTNAYIAGEESACVDEDIFQRGLCLPSDNKMTPEEQDIVIDLIRRCFR